MDETMKYTGKIIKELREKAGESQEQLAEALNAPNRETIARWESGSRDLKREHIISIAKHFKVSTDYLLGLSDVQSADTDIQTACKVTGLSEEAIKNMLAAGYTDFFECLLSNIDISLLDKVDELVAIKAVSKIFREESVIFFCRQYDLDINNLTPEECLNIVGKSNAYYNFEIDMMINLIPFKNSIWDTHIRFGLDEDYEKYKINMMTAEYMKKLVAMLEVKMLGYLESIGQREHFREIIEKSMNNAQHNTEEE